MSWNWICFPPAVFWSIWSSFLCILLHLMCDPAHVILFFSFYRLYALPVVLANSSQYIKRVIIFVVQYLLYHKIISIEVVLVHVIFGVSSSCLLCFVRKTKTITPLFSAWVACLACWRYCVRWTSYSNTCDTNYQITNCQDAVIGLHCKSTADVSSVIVVWQYVASLLYALVLVAEFSTRISCSLLVWM